MAEITKARNYGLLTDLDKLAGFVKGVLERDLWVGFDVETGYTGPDRPRGSLLLDWDKQFVCGFSISHNPNFGRYVPLRHDDADNVDEALAWEIMEPLLTKGKLAIHHEKFERRNVRKAANIEIGSAGGTVVDTMLDSYILSEFALAGAIRASNGLKDLVKILFDYDQPHIESLFPGYTDKQMKALRFNVLKLTTEVVGYCCEDAAWALGLMQRIDGRARNERGTMHRIEHEISQIMADVEAKGVAIAWSDMEIALSQANRFLPRITQAAKDGLSELVGGRDLSGLNLGSSKQMQELLYRDIGLTTTRTTKKPDESKPKWQQMSTDAIAMETLSHKYPQIKKLLEVREVGNLSRRLKKWLDEYTYATDGRVHAGYNQVVVGSGRFSANDPAIQQLPKEWRWSVFLGADCNDKDTWANILSGEFRRGLEEASAASSELTEPEAASEAGEIEEDAAKDSVEDPNGIDYWTGNFRAFVIAAPGHYLLTYDYSQVELRVLGGVTQEPALLRAFAEGVDVHKMTAAMMLHKKPEDITYKERQIGKMLNFALLYQMGEKSMAERLGITLEEAKKLFAQYFAAFSRIGTWQDAATKKGIRLGYAETPFGRKYTVWELQSPNRAIRAKGERVLVNAPIQGGAADYMKMAMIRVTKKLKELGWWMDKCTIIMNQHDSLTFEVSDDLDPAEVRRILEPCVAFPVPKFPKIVAEWELGQRWGTSTAWDEDVRPVWDGEHWQLVKDEAATVPVLTEEAVGEPEKAVGTIEEDTEAQAPAKVEESVTGTVVIQVPTPVKRSAFEALLEFLASRKGEEETWLETPQGKFRLGNSDIGVSDQSHLSLMLGNVTVEVKPGSGALAALTASMSI